MARPIVTVCIPTYNGAAYIEACLSSVLEQTYRALEILIIDDCSSDATIQLVEGFRAADKRIRLIQNPHNLGLVGNWNKCVELAQGEYIKFLFQDDLLYPKCIAQLVTAANGRAGFAFCSRDVLFDQGATTEDRQAFERRKRLCDEIYAQADIISPGQFCDLILRHGRINLIGEPTVTLIHRDLFARYGKFSEDLIHLCDMEFWYRIATNEPIALVHEPLAAFRVHSGAATSHNYGKRRFRASVLDPLVILHRFAFDPLYKNLRAISLSRPDPVDLDAMLLREAWWVRSQARKRAAKQPAGDSSQLDEFEKLAGIYPGLRRVPPLLTRMAWKWATLISMLPTGKSTRVKP